MSTGKKVRKISMEFNNPQARPTLGRVSIWVYVTMGPFFPFEM